MKKHGVYYLIFIIMLITGSSMRAQDLFESDHFESEGNIIDITFIGHGTLMLKYNSTVIHIDPVSGEADYTGMPDADIILVTHEHGDHLDGKAINLLLKEDTKVICNPGSSAGIDNAVVMINGESRDFSGVIVEAVPAYNIVNERSPGNPFHPRGSGNGYVISLGDFRIYIAGDTEDIPEMGSLGKVDIAFLPMNLPYTMTPEMVANAAGMIKPRILYPYHFGSTDTSRLLELLEGEPVEIRIRKME